MIDKLNKSLAELLKGELPITNGQPEINFDQPVRDNSMQWTNPPTINLYLYDIRENVVLRKHQWQTEVTEVISNGSRKRSPFRIDCHYMLTVWAGDTDSQHRLIFRCLQALLRNAKIPQEYLVDEVAQQPFGVPLKVAMHDQLTNPTEVWNALENDIRPMITCVATLAVDPWTEIPEAPPVEGIEIRNEPINRVVGRVMKDNKPQRNIQVIVRMKGVEGRTAVGQTDQSGYFKFSLLPSKETPFVFEFWLHRNRPPIEREVVVPSRSYDFDFTEDPPEAEETEPKRKRKKK